MNYIWRWDEWHYRPWAAPRVTEVGKNFVKSITSSKIGKNGIYVVEEAEDNILVDPHSLVDGRWEESGQYQWEEGNYELRVGFFEKNGELKKSLGLEELNNLAVSKNKYEDKYSRDILQVMKRSKGR